MSTAVIAIIASVLFGTFSIVSTLIGIAWKLRGDLSSLEVKFAAEMSANREVMLAMNRRIERLESKIP